MTLLFSLFFALALAADEGDVLNTGKFESLPKKSPFTVVAPHGSFDKQTDKIARAIGEKLGWNALIVTGFRTEFRPLNVNRPSEGIHMKSIEEKKTARSEKVYGAFLEALKSTSPETPKLYVELHGQKELDHIDIAVVGIAVDLATRIKTILEKSLKSQGIPTSVKIEGVDSIKYAATGAKQDGSLSLYPKSLHIELPRELRDKKLEPLIAALIESLAEIQKLF